MGTDSGVEKTQETLSLMSGMAIMLQSCNAEKELFDVTYFYLPQLFEGIAGKIFLMDDKAQNLIPVFEWGGDGEEKVVPDPTGCTVFKNGGFAGAADSAKGCAQCGGGAHCLPFRNEGQTFGALCLGRAGQDLTPQMRGLAFVTAEYLTLAVSNLRLRNKLYDLSVRDPLTKLYNRRRMDEILDGEIETAGRDNTTRAIIMIDLDHFKRLNDTFGHDAGDEVLKTVARTLLESLEPGDSACRFGGEEFFALMTGGTMDEYIQRTENIRQQIQALKIMWKEQHVSPVTASLGLAIFPRHGQTPQELIRAADQALYRAKEGGRNRVGLAS